MLLFCQRTDHYVVIFLFQILTVICAVLTDDPNFAEPIPNVTVSLGRDASLPCVVNNLGTYKVAWIHIDRQMILTIHRHVIARIPRFGITHDSQKTWLLHVKGAQPEDRGYYMCQVNTNPMISQVGYLQVVVPPNIIDEESSTSSVSIRENQNLSLTCKAEGSPTPKISWKREDGNHIATDRKKKAVEKLYGDTLNLTRVNRADMGAYLCIASNGVPPSVSKRIILDVEFSPMIWVPNQLVGAPSGTDVTIDCQTEAHPKSINYWSFRDAKTMLFPNKKYVTSDTENSYRIHMRLTIRDLGQSDFGNYKCISKNSLGETEGSIRLYEIPKPSLAPKSASELNRPNKDVWKPPKGPVVRNMTGQSARDNRQHQPRPVRPTVPGKLEVSGNLGPSSYSRSQIVITVFGVVMCFTSSHHIPS
ncbi:lachesin isoform X1 [Sipha flava]|uniref:Lachesin n=1 Tax=Sipha flava TaxID=143950 RepID=A0A2S2QN20_9HEMI|nr:lachesin isoform X1 [Sipha flava]